MLFAWKDYNPWDKIYLLVMGRQYGQWWKTILLHNSKLCEVDSYLSVFLSQGTAEDGDYFYFLLFLFCTVPNTSNLNSFHLFQLFLHMSFKLHLYKSGFFFFLPWMQHFIYPILNNWLWTVIIMLKQEVTLSWEKKKTDTNQVFATQAVPRKRQNIPQIIQPYYLYTRK